MKKLPPITLQPGKLFNQIAHQPVRALTWKQPYGSLMLPPHGKIETRVWPTKYRGWVLICAGMAKYQPHQIQAISGHVQYHRIKEISESNILPLGLAIGIGYLSDCRLMQPEDADACFVGYTPAEPRYCHVYEGVREIKHLPWKGKQGWSTVPEDFLKQIIVL